MLWFKPSRQQSTTKPLTHSVLPPGPGGMRRRKYKETLMGRDNYREGSLITYGHRQKTDSACGKNKINLICYKSNQNEEIEKRSPNLKTPSPHSSLLPSSALLLISLSPLPKQRRGMGNGAWGQFITHCSCHSFLLRGRTSCTLPLLQCGVPPTGDSPP